MIIHQLTHMGIYHSHHCEDAIFSGELGNNQFLIAVMDGCTMGIESHFASTLFSKLLRKIFKKYYYESFIHHTKKENYLLLNQILKDLFKQIIHIKNELDLDKYELLSTIILGVLDKKLKTAELICIGDGIIYADGIMHEFEQDNQPDYLAYHLHKNFEEWYFHQHQKLSLTDIKDLSISTDGIFTFSPFDNKQRDEIEQKDIINLLLKDQSFSENEHMLKKKIQLLKNDYGLSPTDDLGIIRVIL